ncbi:DUF1592 domain-containing protein [bacterium]|nr:DUF1592 domain-containing protein [bacterium]
MALVDFEDGNTDRNVQRSLNAMLPKPRWVGKTTSRVVALVLITFLTAGTSVAADAKIEPVAPDGFTKTIVPFLDAHCTGCHGGDEPEGGLGLDAYKTTSNIQTDYERWETIRRVVFESQMPPVEEEQPETDQRAAFIAAVEVEMATFDCEKSKRPGHVTLRRLNRVEYNNTIRDLVGLKLTLADDFPSDDVGEGFDNIGDVLTLPPILLEKYLAAAETVSDAMLKDKDARKRFNVRDVKTAKDKGAAVRENIERFAERAFRRPVTLDEMDRLFKIARYAYENLGADQDEIFSAVVTAVLTSPHFLFRVERDPHSSDKDGIRDLGDFELASRLSYFLWSSMPDETLLQIARDDKLTDPDVLAGQAIRMLADPKADALVQNFAGQWLQLRDVTRLAPDPDLFPAVTPELQADMRRETEAMFADMMRNNRSVLSLLDADYSFLNDRLAKHYGIAGVKGDAFQQVAMKGNRRGILTHASILMLTSNPTRTSPVKRGKWILDNLLGEPPPAPPADVPELDEDAETLGSLREQMEQHRSNEACAVCHRKMDALGFGLENFDAVGAWREKDGRFKIDPTGALPGNREFAGPVQLVKILADEKKTAFTTTMTRKMLTYALGRGLLSYDRCTVQEIVGQLEKDSYRFDTLVKTIVRSDAFRQRERATE